MTTVINRFFFSPQNHGENDVNHYSNVWYFHSTDDLNDIHETIIQQGFSFAQPVRLKNLIMIKYN